MIAIAVQHMLAAGMDHAAIVEAVREMEEEIAPKRSAGAMRQERYRRNKASQSVTSDIPPPFPETKVSSTPPSKTQTLSSPLPPIVPPPPETAKHPEEPLQQAVKVWNAVAEKRGLPIAKSCSADRRRAIRARLSEGGIDGWIEAVNAVDRSPFCRGENDRSWRADIDFVAQPKSYRRLREGSFGAKATPANVVDLRPARMFTA